MGNLNKVMLIGRLGQDPEKRITPSGSAVVTVSLATSERFNDRQGQKQERTEWHRVVFWNKQAELIEQYCKKGSQLYIEGSIHTNEWQDKDGNKRYTTEIQARNMQFLDSPSGGGGASAGGGYSSGGGGGYGAPAQGGGGYGAPSGGGYNAPSGGQAPTGGGGYGPPPTGPMGGNDDFIEDDIPF